jgi:hypothetical protein
MEDGCDGEVEKAGYTATSGILKRTDPRGR